MSATLGNSPLARSLKELESLSSELNALVTRGEWDAAAVLAPRIGQSFAAVQQAFASSVFVSAAERAACARSLRTILANYRETGSRLSPWLTDVRQLLADMSGNGG